MAITKIKHMNLNYYYKKIWFAIFLLVFFVAMLGFRLKYSNRNLLPVWTFYILIIANIFLIFYYYFLSKDNEMQRHNEIKRDQMEPHKLIKIKTATLIFFFAILAYFFSRYIYNSSISSLQGAIFLIIGVMSLYSIQFSKYYYLKFTGQLKNKQK